MIQVRKLKRKINLNVMIVKSVQGTYLGAVNMADFGAGLSEILRTMFTLFVCLH